jgi:long-chain acyl-CoA synthetase
MRDLIELHLEDFRPDVVVAPGDPATLLATTGAGGAPHLVLGTHQALAVAGAQVAAWIGESVGGGAGALLLATPLAHAPGLALAQGAALSLRLPLALLPEPSDIEELLRTVRRVRPAAMCAAPEVYESILAHPGARRVHWSSLRLSIAVGAPLAPETRRAFEALTGGRVIAGYGTTETQAVVTLSPTAAPDKPGSAGLPLPDTEVRIVDQERGARTLFPGEVGEIAVHVPEPMRGYWRDAADTHAALHTGADGRAWLHTGDLGYLDEDGFLFVVGRRRDRRVGAHTAALAAAPIRLPDAAPRASRGGTLPFR